MANIAEWTSARVMRVEMCCQKAVLMFGPDSHLVEKVREVLEVIPALLIIENLADAKLMVGSTFPLWSPTDVFNVASAVYKTPGVRLDPDSTTSKKGDFATGSPHDLTLPMPSNSAKADEIWCRYEWDECVQEFNLERLVEIAHYDGCEFDMFMIAECRVMLRLRNFPSSPLTVSGIIKLHSDIDDAQRIGELITEGELHLRECGPEKKSLVLGITDLKKIRWFRLTLDGFPLITQSFTDADARRSICGYLHAEPCLLGIHRQLNIHRLPSSWKLLKHLGSGFTSNVYLVDRSGSKFAVKSPRLAFDLQKDIQYLELLRGIDGVPMIQEKIHNMIVLKPLCAHFSVESFFECGTSSLGDLVETLWCSHERGVVNKDLHAKNIMIGESLYDGGKIRFFILDWGFAAHAGVTSNFSGSFVTASDQVLCQLHAIFGQVVVSVNDDLVSLVRCLFLIFNREVNFALHKVKDHPEKIIEFWQQHIEKSPFWRKAQGAALQLQYDGLKELFQMSTRESLIEGCLY